LKVKLIWLVACLLLSSGSAGQTMTLYTENYKPFQYYNEKGELDGFGIELVKMIFDEAGIKIEGNDIKLIPWVRAYNLALNNVDSAVFVTVKNEVRDKLFKWVGPLAPRKKWLYKLKERTDIQLRTLEDAKRFVVGSTRGSATTNYMLELGLDITFVDSQKDILVPLFLSGRLDLVHALEITMVYHLRDLGLAPDIVEKTILLDDRFKYYLAVNIQTSDAIVLRLQQALDFIKSSGAYAKLREQYTK